MQTKTWGAQGHAKGTFFLAELALHFDMEPAAMDGMLQILTRKGRVECIGGGKGATCKGCALVNPAEAAIL
jgi:hypothetical protein